MQSFVDVYMIQSQSAQNVLQFFIQIFSSLQYLNILKNKKLKYLDNTLSLTRAIFTVWNMFKHYPQEMLNQPPARWGCQSRKALGGTHAKLMQFIMLNLSNLC